MTDDKQEHDEDELVQDLEIKDAEEAEKITGGAGAPLKSDQIKYDS
jgi:hypothetical protein